MRPSTASVAAVSGLATVAAADGLPIDSIPFSCIRICGPVVELTNICNLGPMTNSRLLAKRDAIIPASQQLKQRGAKNARYRRHKSKREKRGGFEVLIPPPTTFPPGPAEPPEPTAVKPGPGPDGGPKGPPAPPPGGPQPPAPPPTQDPEKGPGGPGKEPKPKPPHEHDEELETTDAHQVPATSTVPSAPEPSAPEAVIEIPSSSFATTTETSSRPPPPAKTHTNLAPGNGVKEKPSPSESSASTSSRGSKSVIPAESDVATDAGDDNDDDGDDDGEDDEEFDDSDNSNGEWDLKGTEESCVCDNDSFDVASISAYCASCIDQAGDLQNNINLILHTCNFPKKEYTSKDERAADGIRVRAERPSLPLNAAINVEKDDGAGSLTSGRMVAAAAVAVMSGLWCLL